MLPPGYYAHPHYPGYMYNAAGDVQPIPASAPAVPVAPPVAELPYGMLDVEYALQQEQTSVFQRDKEVVWLDFDDVTAVGQSAVLTLRLLPPLKGERTAWHKFAQHRVPAALVPNAPEGRQFIYVDCYDMQGAPGQCPIDGAIQSVSEHDGGEAASLLRPRVKVAYQALDVGDPTKHWVQKPGADGLPAIDPATGQPAWAILPGIITIGNQLHSQICLYVKQKGDPTHVENGYTMKFIKEKTGPEQINVKYTAIDAERGPIDPVFRPVLNALVDLRRIVSRFRPREEMEAIAQRILAKYGFGQGRVVQQPMMPGAEMWTLHPAVPGWQVNQFGALRPLQQPTPMPAYPSSVPAHAMPPMPPVPQPRPAMPGMPPPPPVRPPVVSAGPPPVARPLPPPVAPGFPVGVQTAMPMAAPPLPPGMPPGLVVQPPPPPPPMPGMPPPPPQMSPVAMTPEELEAQIASARGDIPF